MNKRMSRIEILELVRNGTIPEEEGLNLLKGRPGKERGGGEALNSFKQVLLAITAELLKVQVAELDEYAEFDEYGFDSISFNEYAQKINSRFELDITPALFYQYTTPASLLDYLAGEFPEKLAVPEAGLLPVPPEAGEGPDCVTAFLNDLMRIIADLLKIDIQNLVPGDSFSELGFDSISFTGLANRLNGEFGFDITPSLFYQQHTIEALQHALLNDYADSLLKRYSGKGEGSGGANGPVPRIAAEARLSAIPFSGADNPAQEKDPVAIVGMSAVFPGASDLEEFWEKLENSSDLVREIPAERWDWRQFFGDPRKEENKSESKWGGFIDGYDLFDAAFFGISRTEAELMDPQQRLFLEHTWKALEDAGIAPSSLAGEKVGVWAGAGPRDYNELLLEHKVPIQAHLGTGTSHSILPNRISFYLNLHGPSNAIDTACSSSLIALHRAMLSLECGESELAIVGGANTLFTPKLFIAFSKAGMLSPVGRCKTFDASADGYVRGEGVGVVILKPLSRALADGHSVYAVIKGSAENHGGKAKSLTAPNPLAQAQVIRQAMEKAGVEPESVTFIETHGTGTKLGDPVEIDGLKLVFPGLGEGGGVLRPGQPHCGLGSVKTNIGHLETAAGIAGLIKVALALKHRRIPGNVHFHELNPYIKLNSSPFYIVGDTKDWETVSDAMGRVIPRRAGLSSFGFGGANAHVVLEECPDQQGEMKSGAEENFHDRHIFVFSAKTKESLLHYASVMVQFLRKRGGGDDPSLPGNLAYTLQVGRDHLSHRLAFTAVTLNEICEILDQFRGEFSARKPEFLYNQVGRRNDKSDVSGFELAEMVRCGEYGRILELWTSGRHWDWETLYQDTPLKHRRIHLPGYQFNHQRYWIPRGKEDGAVVAGGGGISPLLTINESTLMEEKFRSFFDGSEFFLRDHVIGNDKILPGVAYLEMAASAGNLAAEAEVAVIENIMWVKPVLANQRTVEVVTRLLPDTKGIVCEITGPGGEGAQDVNFRCRLQVGPAESGLPDRYVLEDLKKDYKQRYNKATIYKMYGKKGFHYGEGFQSLECIDYNRDTCLARLELPAFLAGGAAAYHLHPSLMDGALQSLLAFLADDFIDSENVYLPFSMEKLEIYGSLPEECYVFIRNDSPEGNKNLKRFNLEVLDYDGRVLLRMHKFSLREYRRMGDDAKSSALKLNSVTEYPVYYYVDKWCLLPQEKKEKPQLKSLILFNIRRDETLLKNFVEAAETSVIEVRMGEGFLKQKASPGMGVLRYQLDLTAEASLKRLFKDILDSGYNIESIMYAGERFQSGIAEDWLHKRTYTIYTVFRIIKILMPFKEAKKPRFLYLYEGGKHDYSPYHAALSGFAKTVRKENDKFLVKILRTDSPLRPGFAAEVLGEFVEREWSYDVRYEGSTRYVRLYDKRSPEEIKPAPVNLKNKGVYLITGGLGGLGRIFTEYFARSCREPVLVLSGRTPEDQLPGQKKDFIRNLELSGARVVYVVCDVADHKHVKKMLAALGEQYGGLDGIVHSAGINNDAYLVNKTVSVLGSSESILNKAKEGARDVEKCLEIVTGILDTMHKAVKRLDSTEIEEFEKSIADRKTVVREVFIKENEIKNLIRDAKRHLLDTLQTGSSFSDKKSDNTASLVHEVTAELSEKLSQIVQSVRDSRNFDKIHQELERLINRYNIPLQDTDNGENISQALKNSSSELQEAKKAFNEFSARLQQTKAGLATPNREIFKVLLSKIDGTLNLDKYSSRYKLDFFIMFSSIAAAVGNPGQIDYAYANCFMDHFADYRNKLVQKGERSGNTISIGWPLWKEGGMQVAVEIEKRMREKMGMMPLATENGINAFENILKLGNLTHVVLTEGISEKLDIEFGVRKDVSGGETHGKPGAGPAVKEDVSEALTRIIAGLLKIPESEIDGDAEFTEYGIDSILMMSVMTAIEELYGETLTPNALSEYPSLHELAGYLVEKGIACPGSRSVTGTAEPPGKLIPELKKIIADLLKIDGTEIEEDAEFAEYGVDSILMMTVMDKVEEQFAITLTPNVLSEYPSISLLAGYLRNQVKGVKPASPPVDPPRTYRLGSLKANVKEENPPGHRKVAVIGMSCRLPGAADIAAFWENLEQGRDCVREVPPGRWEIRRHYDADKKAPRKSYSKWGGYLDDIDLFDAEFFGIKDEDALILDPQHRIMLQLAQHLLDNAGYTREDISGSRTSVYLGATDIPYLMNHYHEIPPELMKHVMVNKIQNMMAARISDFYNLHGASLTIDTACSSSLVAVHQACRSILEGESEMAVAGGIEILLDEFNHIGFSKSGALADGPKSYVFDERANGFVLGEGGGLILLKDYGKAVEDGDNILGVILASAVNNDGHTMGLTVPSMQAQQEVIKNALDASGVGADSIGYYEAHGTGTLLGDPIEIKAVTEVYARYTGEKNYCAVGSVKTNIGHLLHGAGIAGVIKILLAMQKRKIPPTLNCEKPHPRFKFEESPFFPNLSLRDWDIRGEHRRAAISSFGFGGTNCHCVLEDYKPAAGRIVSRKPFSPHVFKLKRYWLGKEIESVVTGNNKIMGTEEEYRSWLEKLSRGEISPDDLLDMEGAR